MAAEPKRDRVYRIRRPNGTFRGPGKRGETGSRGKLWPNSAETRKHLMIGSHWNSSVDEVVETAGAEGCEVVEYELREVRRIPVREFLARGAG